jgi:hypothetical protein
MTERLIPFLLTCSPLAAWTKLYRDRLQQWPRAVALVALGIVTANATLAAGTFLYYSLRPSPTVAPWEDPQILQLGLLFLLAPIGMIVGLVAAARGTPKWLIWIVEGASVPLLLVGLLAGASV